ncbi:hypothetical protein ABXN37_22575 [Piscinibacter sakaiensis]|uniref:AcrIC5-like domain-containing protein n=1 Tax=Piscinibacter sakaiensis TaxID=1547922 RepID=A0A0K8P6R4_PISS1|nr:hypothetical protein [Piscinibacter sakaiensis]GAP37910.1 hypothetical protein ISF6_4104 [Piscinibacter sakaiensis]
MLKIRNLTTGEVIDLVRDAAHTHPEWVHEQCDTCSESELQRMLDSYSLATMAEHAGRADECGIYMPAEGAYEVTNPASAHSFGVYVADSAEAAVLACVRDAGYDSLEAAEHVTGKPVKLVATKLSDAAAFVLRHPDAAGAMDAMMAAGIEGDQDWGSGATTYVMPDGSRVRVSDLDVEALGSSVTLDGKEVDFSAAVALMDDELRAALHNELAPCSDQAFLDAYAAAHAEKFGTDFQVA